MLVTRKKSLKKYKKMNSTKKCMEKFADKKIKYWTSDYTNEITKLQNIKNLTKEEKILLKKVKKQKANQIKSLKKQYKLMNCNINCKGTLAEPGPPNQIPKSMQKIFGYSKPLIKIFTKRRKDIFKNKTNVLIDNFYENISPKIKKKTFKRRCDF